MAILDVTGEQFGHLTTIAPTDLRQDGSVIWECQCICGNVITRSLRNLRHTSKTGSCGCQISKRVNYSDMIGSRHGHLLVISSNGHNMTLLCDCGNSITIPHAELIHGRRCCGMECKYSQRKEYGESDARMLYLLLKNYAKKESIPFELSFDEYKEVTKRYCLWCHKKPEHVINSNTAHRHGLYVHNKIQYLDRNIGYTINNVITLCLPCSFKMRAKRSNRSRYAKNNNDINTNDSITGNRI